MFNEMKNSGKKNWKAGGRSGWGIILESSLYPSEEKVHDIERKKIGNLQKENIQHILEFRLLITI